MQEAQIHHVRTQDFRDTYANILSVSINDMDFILTFGSSTANADGSITIENHTRIYLSPQRARQFIELLNKHLASWEANNNPRIKTLN